MELFVFLMIVICIGCLLFSFKKHEGNNRESPLKGDDFNDRSVGCIFLFEEFIDTPADNKGSSNQGVIQTEEADESFIEEDFLDYERNHCIKNSDSILGWRQCCLNVRTLKSM